MREWLTGWHIAVRLSSVLANFRLVSWLLGSSTSDVDVELDVILMVIEDTGIVAPRLACAKIHAGTTV